MIVGRIGRLLESHKMTHIAKTKNPLQIIGLVGPSGVGKSAVASVLMEHHGYRNVPMAGPLKRMLTAGGLTYGEVYGVHKERPSDILGGKTPRHAMQTLGTEWGRDLIHPDIWVNMWTAAYRRDAVESGYGKLQPVVADDVRFENEVEMIRRLGGTIVEVCRPHYAYSGAHRSEVGVERPHHVISNTGDLALLRSQVGKFMKGW